MKIKKWLVPGKHNNYHPHAIRPIGLSLLVLLLVLVNSSYNLTVTKEIRVLGYATNISSGDIVSLTNQERTSRGIAALATNAQLTQAAQAKVQHMFANNYWAHNAPDGTTPWYFISAAGYSYTTAGENLAKDFDTSAGLVSGWMGSPGHQANILNTNFKDIGVATANGVLQGSETTLVVAMYAAPTSPPPAPPPAAPAAPPPKQAAPPPKQAAPPKAVPQPAVAPATTQSNVSPPSETPTPVSESKPAAATPPVSDVPSPDSPEVFTNYIIDDPISVREKLNWAQNISVYVLSVVFLLMVLKHTVVWRTQRRGWRHIWLRAHPAAQYGLILVAIVASVVSGTGVIR